MKYRAASARYWGLALVLVLMYLYASSLAPGPVDNGDSGEFLAAAANWSVAHPSGYPTYSILAGFVYRLPLPGLAPAERVAALSMLAAVGGCLCIWGLLLRAGLPPSAAFVFAVTAGTNPVIWGQAVMAEVYTLHLLFLALCWYGLWRWYKQGLSQAAVAGFGLLLGLALGNHLTMLLALPLILGTLIYFQRTGRCTWRDWEFMGAGLLLGLLVYGYLPWAAMRTPFTGWGDCGSLRGFIEHATLAQFRGDAFQWHYLPEKLGLLGNLLLTGFGPLIPLLAFWTLLRVAQRGSAMARIMVGGTVLYAAAVILAFGQANLEVLEASLPVHLIPVLAAVVAAGGYGWHQLPKTWVRTFLILVMAIGCVVQIAWTYPRVDRHDDHVLTMFVARLSQMLPPGGVLFVEKDDITFPFWYEQARGAVRNDIQVINGTLCHFAWYRRQWWRLQQRGMPPFARGLTVAAIPATPDQLASLAVAAAPAAYAFPDPDPDLGLTVQEIKGFLRVIKPDPDQPAEAARILQVMATVDGTEFNRAYLTPAHRWIRDIYRRALNNIAISLAESGQPARGLEYLYRARQVDPDDPDVIANLVQMEAAASRTDAGE